MIHHNSYPDRWVFLFTGFRQTEKFYAGIRKLEEAIYGRIASTTTRVELHGWQSDISYLADRVTARPAECSPPRIDLVGYSWGGATAAALAEEFERRGYQVNTLALCDAVSRGPIPWISIRSLLGPNISLILPKNIDYLIGWRQITKGLTNLQGSKVIPHTRTRWVIPEVILSTVPHESMDEQPKFLRTVLNHLCPETKETNTCDI